jgi:hypothetical protein
MLSSVTINHSSLQERKTRFWDEIYKPRIRKLQVPFDNLDNGKRILREESECDRYIALYGAHHFHKLYRAFTATNFQYIENKNIEIIDWGCGQALATCVLLDYFIENNINPKIISITLVEPSSLALWRGYSFVRKMLKDTNFVSCEARTVNKSIDDLNCSDFRSNQHSIKIHLFSNIIDVDCFNLDLLYQLIVKSFQGVNRLICTSPYQKSKNYRLDKFYNLFSEYTRIKNEFHSDEAIHDNIFNVRTGMFESWSIKRYEKQFTIHL